jgi:hypothetical protein
MLNYLSTVAGLRIPVVLLRPLSSVRQNRHQQEQDEVAARQVVEGHRPSAGARSRGAERPILLVHYNAIVVFTQSISPCPAVPFHALPCPAIPCPAIPWPALPCPATHWPLVDPLLATPGLAYFQPTALHSMHCTPWCTVQYYTLCTAQCAVQCSAVQ